MGLYNEAYRVVFDDVIRHALQQTTDIIVPNFTPGEIKGEYLYVDFLDTFSATTVTGTNAATVTAEPTFSRRRVGLTRKTVGALLDTGTDIKMASANTLSSITEGALYALKRGMDEVAYAAFDGDVESGKAGASTTSYDETMTVSGTSGLTKTVLKNTKTKLALNTVGFTGTDDYCFLCTPTQIDDLLADSSLTSIDYIDTKPLIDGEFNKRVLGFRFIQAPQTLVTASGGIRKCFGFSKRGMFWGVGDAVKTRINERDDLTYSTQIFVEFFAGGLRLREGMVSKVMLTES